MEQRRPILFAAALGIWGTIALVAQAQDTDFTNAQDTEATYLV
jgi:hypothetical protein